MDIIETERALLGCLLLDNKRFDDVDPIVKDSDLSTPQHQTIYRTIAGLINLGTPADEITIASMLRETKSLDDVGGLAYLSALARCAPSAVAAASYAKLVREESDNRRLNSALAECSRVSSTSSTAADKLARCESVLYSLADRSNISGGIVEVKSAILPEVRKIEELSRTGEVDTLGTGYGEIDAVVGGLHPGQFVVIAARPSMGKTSLAICMAYQIASTYKIRVVFFSLEMTTAQLLARLLSVVSGLTIGSIVKPFDLSAADWSALTSASAKLNEVSIAIDDTSLHSVQSIRSSLRKAFRSQHRPGLIVVDHIQIMRSDRRKENRTEELSEISSGLKALSKEFACPVIALSQLNRALETRPDKRPGLSDLRGSGTIEQDADVVAFIYRPSYYGLTVGDNENRAEIIVAKNRTGPTGVAALQFDAATTRFY